MSVVFVTSRIQDCDYPADRKTPLGNPFRMYSEDQRNKVCDQFYLYFEKQIFENNPLIMEQLKLIKQKAIESNKPYFKIGCHCSPKRCHVDTICYFLNNFSSSI
jgi:hypothetical protein